MVLNSVHAQNVLPSDAPESMFTKPYLVAMAVSLSPVETAPGQNIQNSSLQMKTLLVG